MNFRSTIGRRATLAVAGAALAILSVSAGAAMTASAASDPGSQPAQEYTEWEPGTSGLWLTGNSGTPWVADQYDVIASGNETTTYAKVDGSWPQSGDADSLRSNLNYNSCWWYANQAYITCAD